MRTENGDRSAKYEEPIWSERLCASHLGLCTICLFFLACSSSPGSTVSAFSPNHSPEGRPALPGAAAGASVLQYHRDASHAGFYLDPALSTANVASFHTSPDLSVAIPGPTYAQPLYLSNGPGGKNVVIVATEVNQVLAIDAASGATVWQKSLGTPVPLSALPCGNIDPLGVTGTPVIDPAAHALYLDAMITPDAGATKKHEIFALSTDDGSILPGWPVDVTAALAAQGVSFTSEVQNQRGALAVQGGFVYAPYGGHDGDCGDYRGWVVGVSTSDPKTVRAWSTEAPKGGAWGPEGIASDGTSLFVSTGNTEGATTWSGGEAVIRLPFSLVFSHSPTDFFTPADWEALDANDTDIGSAGPVLFDLPGSTPTHLVTQMGKNGHAYLLNRDNLGGIGGAVTDAAIASGVIISAPAVYTTARGTYLVTKGAGTGCPGGRAGDLLALRVVPGSPPQLQTAWCATQNGKGSPIATSTDGSANVLVWGLGAEGGEKLVAFDGDTGQVVFTSDAMESASRFETPIAANGFIYIAGNMKLYGYSSAPPVPSAIPLRPRFHPGPR